MSLRNRRLAVVRHFLHRMWCQCDEDRPTDHARRTQHERARRLVDSYEPTLEYVPEWRKNLHEALCAAVLRTGECANAEQHELKIVGSGLARILRQRIEEA